MHARDRRRTEARPRVFVSSVMKDYRDYREAARQRRVGDTFRFSSSFRQECRLSLGSESS